jgi:hypothetical protein
MDATHSTADFCTIPGEDRAKIALFRHYTGAFCASIVTPGNRGIFLEKQPKYGLYSHAEA